MKRKDPTIAPHKVHPNSLKNLKPVKPGERLNPTGINRGRHYSDEYLEFGNGVLCEKLRLKINAMVGEELLPKGTTWKSSMAARAHIEAVMNGVIPAMKELREGVEGKSTQRVELSGGGPEDPLSLLIGAFDREHQKDE